MDGLLAEFDKQIDIHRDAVAVARRKLRQLAEERKSGQAFVDQLDRLNNHARMVERLTLAKSVVQGTPLDPS